jgi:hypothetical protein
MGTESIADVTKSFRVRENFARQKPKKKIKVAQDEAVFRSVN